MYAHQCERELSDVKNSMSLFNMTMILKNYLRNKTAIEILNMPILLILLGMSKSKTNVRLQFRVWDNLIVYK